MIIHAHQTHMFTGGPDGATWKCENNFVGEPPKWVEALPYFKHCCRDKGTIVVMGDDTPGANQNDVLAQMQAEIEALKAANAQLQQTTPPAIELTVETTPDPVKSKRGVVTP